MLFLWDWPLSIAKSVRNQLDHPTEEPASSVNSLPS